MTKVTDLNLCNCLTLAAITAVSMCLVVPIAASAKTSDTSVNFLRDAQASAALYGMDYEAAAATPCVAEGDGFVNVAAGCYDTTSGLTWSGSFYLNQPYSGISYYPTYYQARDYCAALTDGGLSGWRLPSKTEMQSAATRRAVYHLQLTGTNNYTFSGTLAGTSYVYLVKLIDGSVFKALIYDKRWGSYTQVDANCVRNGY